MQRQGRNASWLAGRLAAALVCVLGVLLVGDGASGQATTVAAAGRAQTAPAPAAYGQTNGCNGWVCVHVIGSGLYVERVYVDKVSWATYKGHHDILLPVAPWRVNGVDAWGPPKVEYYPRRNYPNGSQVCGEGWQYTGGRWVLRGRPCLTIHS